MVTHSQFAGEISVELEATLRNVALLFHFGKTRALPQNVKQCSDDFGLCLRNDGSMMAVPEVRVGEGDHGNCGALPRASYADLSTIFQNQEVISSHRAIRGACNLFGNIAGWPTAAIAKRCDPAAGYTDHGGKLAALDALEFQIFG